ncbi:MAG: glycosyltransferase, partial [Chloroflexota bacterium]|nr:glycosyltransferase [Chloroflexota bacterium]
MRVCIDIAPAVHQRAGICRYAREIVTAMLEVDREQEIVVFYNHASTAQVPAPLDRLPRLTTEMPNKAWRLSVLLSHLARNPQDRLFPHVSLFHATDHLLPRLEHGSTIFTLHDLSFRHFPETHSILNRFFLSLMLGRFLHAANAIIAVSEATKRDAIQLYGIDDSKVVVIYEGANPRFAPEPTTVQEQIRQKYNLPAIYALFVGTIEPRKNLVSLLKAFRITRER